MTSFADDAAGPTAKRAPRYSRQRPEVRRRQLIDAAIRCLGQGGMTAFTIDRICREAEVSRGLINHYFPSKDDLLAAAYETMTAYLAEETRGGPADAPLNQLVALIEASFDPAAFNRANLKAWLTLWGELSTNARLQALHRKRYRAYRSDLVRAISAIAEARRREVDAASLALRLIALIDGLWLEWCIDPEVLTAGDAKTACYDLVEADLGPITR